MMPRADSKNRSLIDLFSSVSHSDLISLFMCMFIGLKEDVEPINIRPLTDKYGLLDKNPSVNQGVYLFIN